MAHSASLAGVADPQPVILGTGLTGLAISRALAAASIQHVLVGTQPSETPRLGESLNAEGSLELIRQFPDLEQFTFMKQQLSLFFDGYLAAFDLVRTSPERAFYPLLGLPARVPFLHVDRLGLDRALFETATADPLCQFVEGRPASLDYEPQADRIQAVVLADEQRLPSSYVFDATNAARFVARRIGVPYQTLGGPRRVVFAHYRPAADTPATGAPVWVHATTLLRLETRTDAVAGLAWCIPLGGYVSVGISVDPADTSANPDLLLEWVAAAYARRGMDILGTFPEHGVPVDAQYEHYNHARCYGANWLLAGPSCCQTWFPSAAGVATGLIAARLAPDLLRDPAHVAPIYQTYLDEVVAGHAGLDWLAASDPWAVSARTLDERVQSLVSGNVTRLVSYLGLHSIPTELAFGDALWKFFERDRLGASPWHVAQVPPAAQAVYAFAPTAGAPAQPATLSRPATLSGPVAVLNTIDLLSGRRDVGTAADLVTPDVTLQIDEFRLQGAGAWSAWVKLLRSSTRVAQLELVPGTLEGADDLHWSLTAQWQGLQDGVRAVSAPLSMTFELSNERIADITTQRADYTFVLGESILPRVAFAALLGRLGATAPA